MKITFKKIICVILAVNLIVCLHFNIAVKAVDLNDKLQENQEKQQEAQEKLEYVTEELSEAIVKIQECDDQIKEAEKEIESLNSQLSDLQDEIDEATEKYEEKQKEYEENQALSEERLVTMYEAGESTYLSVLLRSTSILDFISNYYSLQELIESDMKLIESIKQEREEVENDRKALEEKKAELKILKAKREQTSIIMKNNKTKQQNYMNQLSEEEQELQKKIQEYKDEQQRIENLINLAAGEDYGGSYSGGVMAWPIAKAGTYITSGYGDREHPIQGVVKLHSGIDIGNAGFGAPVIAAADGVVTMAGWYGGYGKCVMINHGNGISTLYGHGQEILTSVGTQVKKGDLIMEVGSTGNSTGPHVHFEVRINGTAVNPLPYLSE